MEISFEEFNALSAEQSRRDVKIARLEMELQAQEERHAQELSQLKQERDALWAENQRLSQRLELLETDFENVRFENHWMKQFILLSVERVKIVFSRIRDIKLLSAVKSFVLDMLPDDASPEQIAFASEVMSLPYSEKEEPTIGHANQVVVSVESGAQVLYNADNGSEV